MIELLMMLSLRVVVGVAGTKGPILHPLIAVDLVVLMSMNVRGGGVAEGRQRGGDEKQSDERSSDHRASHERVTGRLKIMHAYKQRRRITSPRLDSERNFDRRRAACGVPTDVW